MSFGVGWKTSERKYEVLRESNVRIKMSDGVEISAEVFRPKGTIEKFPAIIGVHPYSMEGNVEPVKVNATSGGVPLPGEERTRGSLEAGDPNFFVRRGYAHVIMNVRGSGKSGGLFVSRGRREVEDTKEVIEWVAQQSWCDGNVGMFGVSYFAMAQLAVAALQPDHLKCCFAPWASTETYRDINYHGGILSWRWVLNFPKTSLVYSHVRPGFVSKKMMGEKKQAEVIEELLADEDLNVIPELVEVLKNPDRGINPEIVDVLVNPLYGPYWEERVPDFEKIKVPCYLGGDWGSFHLPSSFRKWEYIKAPKKMLIAPEAYLGRALYQLQYESLRWFDYWLKGIDTKIMEEPPIRLFMNGRNYWKSATEWPLPETKWTPFYLHENFILSEREHWTYEGSNSYFDSPWSRGYLEYYTPRLVEETEIIGPLVLNLFAATSDQEVLWSVRRFQIEDDDDKQGNDTGRRILTGGWLRGTHRELDASRSKGWEP